MKIKTRIGRLVLLILVLVLTLGFSSCRTNNNPDPDDPNNQPDGPIIESDILNITNSGTYTINSKYVQINVSASGVILTSGYVPFINITFGDVTLNSVTSEKVVIGDNVHLAINDDSSITKVEVDGKESRIVLNGSLNELIVIETALNTNVDLNNANIDLIGLASKTTFAGSGDIQTVITNDFSFYSSAIPVDYIAYEEQPYILIEGERDTIIREKPIVVSPLPHTHNFTINSKGHLRCNCGQEYTAPYIAFYNQYNQLEDVYLLSSEPLPSGVTYNNLTNTLSYINTDSAKKVAIYTNPGANITVNASNDDISFYGFASKVNVIDASTHIYSTVSVLQIQKGDTVVENTGLIIEIIQLGSTTGTQGEGASLINKGHIASPSLTEHSGNISPIINAVALAEGSKSMGGPLDIGTLAELERFRNAVNAGNDFHGLVIRLTNNITLNDGWIPIGEGTRRVGKTNTDETNIESWFAGNFDGQDYTISNLNNKGFVPNTNRLVIDDDVETYAYGFFGLINQANIMHIIFDNVDIDTSRISGIRGDSVGALVGYAKGGAIEYISVYGSISGHDAVGGIVGRASTEEFVVKECVNNASINILLSGGRKGAGIVGFATGCNTSLFNNVNNGTVSYTVNPGETDYISGVIVVALTNKSTIIDGNTNNASIQTIENGAGVVYFMDSNSESYPYVNNNSLGENNYGYDYIYKFGEGYTGMTYYLA